jgi:hypothetical protein
MVYTDKFKTNVLSLLYYFITRPYNSINYVTCNCGICINCFTYDGSKYHQKNISCESCRLCLECDQLKDTPTFFDYRSKILSINYNENEPNIMINVLIEFYRLLFGLLMLPVTFINFVTYYIFLLSEMTLELSYSQVDHKESNAFKMKINALFKLNIFSKMNKIIKTLISIIYKSFKSDIALTQLTEDLLITSTLIIITNLYCIIKNVSIQYYLAINCSILFFSSLYKILLPVYIFESILLIIIHFPRVLLTIIMYLSGYMYISNSYFLEECLINRCGYPFLKSGSNDEYKIILTNDIKLNHILFRILFIVPSFTYYLMIGVLDIIWTLLFGRMFFVNKPLSKKKANKRSCDYYER